MLPGRVVRARSDEGASTIGIQFLAPPDDRSAPVLALLERLLKALSPDTV